MRRKLPRTLTCPSCGFDGPICDMTIDKMFGRTEEQTLGDGADHMAWQVRCEECEPTRVGYHWFSLDQCDTPAKALGCLMQLNEHGQSPHTLRSFIDLMEHLFGRGTLMDE